jgi:hypothetical protein
MQVKVYEIIWGEAQTTSGTIGGNVVTYSIAFSDQGLPGVTGAPGATGPQANINYTVVSSPQVLTNSQNIAADTSGGSFTLTLPANPSAGDSIDIFDYSETFDTNPLTIARNGNDIRIEGLLEDLICNVEGAYFTMIYTGSTRGWQILPRYGTSGGGGESILTDQGDTLYRGPLVNERLPIGTAGQILKVNSTSTAPEWGAAPATGVTSVTGTAPIASSGGATPAISISAATTSAAGSMSSTDKTKLDGIASGAEVNVQSNWTEADTGSDAFILNKPSTFPPEAHTHTFNEVNDAVQIISGESQIVLDAALYNTFVIEVTEPLEVTYDNFPAGRSINIYLEAAHSGNLLHSFPVETYFAELGIDNTVYSFEGYTTRLLLQNIGSRVMNFGEVVPTNGDPYYGLGYAYPYGDGGIGDELLEEL